MTVRGQALTVRAFGATHTGRVRAGNEDSFFVGDAAFAVADGMGGHQAGEIASAAALEPLRELNISAISDPADISAALAEAVVAANTLVVDRAKANPALEGMGTTLTAIAIHDGQLHVAHVGDSRAYLLRDDEKISQLTTDHTLVERLVQEGRLSRDEAATHPQRNVITRAIGHEATVEVEQLPPIHLQDGDQILLCSDGLSGPVDDERIATILRKTADGEAAVAALLAQANAAGGPDNITAVLLRIGDRWADAPTTTGSAATQQLAASAPGKATTRKNAVAASVDEPSTDGDEIDTDDEDDARASPITRPFGRIAVAALGLLVVVALLAGGGWLLLSRSYYVGEHAGVLAIYQGIPNEVAGVSVSRVLVPEITTTPVSEFPAFRQQAIADGLTAQSLSDARRIVSDLQIQLRESQAPSRGIGVPQTGPTAQPPAGPSPRP